MEYLWAALNTHTLLLNKDQNFHFIIADDDSDDQYLIQKAIKEVNNDFHFTPVTDGLQLMDLLLKKGKFSNSPDVRPDIILLDINMPLLDGFSVLQQIRSNEKLKDIPTYILSTSRLESDVRKSQQLGASAFYSKPAHFSHLKKIIGEILEHTLNFRKNLV